MAKKQNENQASRKVTINSAARNLKVVSPIGAKPSNVPTPASPSLPDLEPVLATRLNLFKADLGKNKTLSSAFNTIYAETSGDWAAISEKLVSENGFKAKTVKKLEFTHHLSTWSGDNVKLVTAFQKNDQTNSMRDIAAKFNRAEFTKLVSAEKAQGKGQTAKVLADNLYNDLFHLQPTAMIKRMVEDAKETPVTDKNISGHIARFLANQPDTFNIKTTSVYEAFKNEDAFKGIDSEHHEAIKTELKTLQRVAAISPVPEVLPVLMKTTLTSALLVSDLPEGQFVEAFSKQLGKNGELIARQTHANAVNARIRNEQALMYMKEIADGTGIAMVDKSMKNGNGMSEAFKLASGKHNLSWDHLFGDADFCECGECTSVYSAASYFVELLQYLRNNNLDKDAQGTVAIKTNPKDISNTPLEKLFNRRPDLKCLQLTCKNTNTILPYVDLVNEVMESYVSFDKTMPFNVGEDETSAELLSQPQHTEYKAYEKLREAVYPFVLPYHQPIDAARIYLNYLGTSRYELINTFRPAWDSKYILEPFPTLLHPKKPFSSPVDADDFKELYEEYLEKVADAEYLGLTQEEYIILTNEAFVSKIYWDKQCGKRNAQDSYFNKIKASPVHEYYGYDSKALMLSVNEKTRVGLTFVKDQFLKRTGVQYIELVELLKTQSLNPNVPEGQALGIMESIQLSYRFLQSLVSIDATTPQEKYKLVVETVFIITTPQGIDALNRILGLDDPCAELQIVVPLTTSELKQKFKDIEAWVCTYFETIGRIIVLEDGAECINGEFFDVDSENQLVSLGKRVQNCQVVTIDSGAVIGVVDRMTGLITFRDGQPVERWLFVGDKGEQGIIVNSLGKYYLLLRKVETCNLDTVRLVHLDGSSLDETEYDRFHRFIRLWRKLGWTINETDKALVGLREVDGLFISPAILHQLSAVKKVLEKTGLELIKLLAFWADISTAGENSLYKRLFLTHNLLGMDPVFHSDKDGLYLVDNKIMISHHIPVLMAALNLSADDLESIMAHEKLVDLSIQNVSILYRYRLLSKTLGLRVSEFISILPLFENPFENADATLLFLQKWEKIEEAGFDFRQINYIIQDLDDVKKPLEPSTKELFQLAKTLYDGLNAIEDLHHDLASGQVALVASSELVREKASLLYDQAAVEKILGILDGSTIFSAVAPKNIKDLTKPLPSTPATLPPAQDYEYLNLENYPDLNRKIKYDAITGSIQVRGILTDVEKKAYKSARLTPTWDDALQEIENQKSKLFNEVFGNAFDNGIGIIMNGDVKDDIDPQNNTAPQKRVEFLRIFLPYLRKELSHRFIVRTLSSRINLDNSTTDLLITDILKESNLTNLYSLFESVKETTGTVSSKWDGHLIPASEGQFTFIVKGGAQPGIRLDDKAIEFEEQPGSSPEWWSSEPIKLQAGKSYKFAVTDLNVGNILWKTPTTTASVISTTVLLPEDAENNTKTAYRRLQKTALLINGFKLSADEIKYLYNSSSDFGNLNFNEFEFDQFLRLESYTRLRNSLPPSKTNLLDFFKWMSSSSAASATSVELVREIIGITGWKGERVEQLIDGKHFNLLTSVSYHNETALLKLQKALEIADKIGMKIDLLFDWSNPVLDFAKCRDSIQHSIRSQYKQEDWERVVKPLSDKLRENQKNALIAYLLVQRKIMDWGVSDADGLFEFFLIDVQMDACMETSRIKQAISSVQLFIQRCFLGLEKEHSDISPNVLDRARWDWIQRYRLWEANRKVFLYPENWIESDLRDDKSPFFKELESELLQKDINRQNVEDALKAYLYKVDEVANMEVVGVYIEEEQQLDATIVAKKLHVFSRTRIAPYFFFYRYLDIAESNWYPWEKMQVDIPSYDMEDVTEVTKDGDTYKLNPKYKTVIGNGCYLTPIVWNNRLLIFFPQFTRKTKSNEDVAGAKSIRDMSDDATDSARPIEYWEIKLAWSEYRNGKWTQKQLSKDAIYDIPDVSDFWNVFNAASKSIARSKAAKSEYEVKSRAVEHRWVELESKAQELTQHIQEMAKNTNPALVDKLRERLEALSKEHIGAQKAYHAAKDKKYEAEANAVDADNEIILNQSHTKLQHLLPPPPAYDIAKYKFVPVKTDNSLSIEVYYDQRECGVFEFDGSNITSVKTDLVGTNSTKVDRFHHSSSSYIYSLQKWTGLNQHGFNDLTVTRYLTPNGYFKFHHSDAHKLLGIINAQQLDSFFAFPIDGIAHNTDKDDVFGAYDDADPQTPNIYHELKRPYSIYNWELFFHTPMMLAGALSKSQQFEEAMKWYHYVFNPMAQGEQDDRFWQFSPFKDLDARNILDRIFKRLKPNQRDDEINEWRSNPFKPHLVARRRPAAYMKWVVMKYVDNLVAWGDHLFRQDTIESINQATQLYVLAGHILGPRPQMIPKRGKVKPQTYLSLLDKWDAFSNAMVELEMTLPYSNQTPLLVGSSNGVVGLANVFGFASTTYFCIPNNPKLMEYWDTIADRLFKIRHCENIEGVFRKLPLFEPPIDPALLVKAAAQGISLDSVLNDLNTPMPNYRFYYLLQKALELCGELKSLGAAMLSAIEKKDNETISLIRARHENSMLNLVMEIKKQQLEEAQKSLEGLQQNRKSPEHRMKYYLQLIGEDAGKVPGLDSDFSEIANAIEQPVNESGLKLIKYEKQDMDKASEAQDWQRGIGIVETGASIMHLIPALFADVKPFGIGAGTTWGGINLGNAAQAVARGLQVHASDLSFASTSAGKKGGFLRSLQDRVMQANAAGYEIKQIDKQILSQQIRIGIANLEISNQQKQIENAQEIEEFLKNKYSNEELYSWMKDSLNSLYHQVYSLAFELAKKAEKVFRFERGLTNSNFIQAGYWDAGRNGLLSGERLYVGLKQLEAAYHENRGYDYEITKHVSLRQLNPLAILQLKQTGTCEFSFPEILFDIDYPGHYKRRIKSVSISIPCVAGPYVGLNGTLRLLENKFRNTAMSNNYQEKTDETDNRFQSFIIPINAIAASSGQNDSGMFELNFKDERYLPFEGAGVISKWGFELPTMHQFNYDTISDVIIHVRYTSLEGGASLKRAAESNVEAYIRSVDQISKDDGLFAIFDLKHDFPSQWYQLISQNQQTMSFGIEKSHFPYLFNNRTLEISEAKVYIKPQAPLTLTDDANENIRVNTTPVKFWSTDVGTLLTEGILDLSDSPIRNWSIEFGSAVNKAAMDEFLILVKYRVTV